MHPAKHTLDALRIIFMADPVWAMENVEIELKNRFGIGVHCWDAVINHLVDRGILLFDEKWKRLQYTWALWHKVAEREIAEYIDSLNLVDSCDEEYGKYVTNEDEED